MFCRLISDLVVVIVSATCGGIAFACAGQPVRRLSLIFALLTFFCFFSFYCLKLCLKIFFWPCDNFQVITGYLLAGSLIGPGGLSFVSEMVQVCYLYSYHAWCVNFVCILNDLSIYYINILEYPYWKFIDVIIKLKRVFECVCVLFFRSMFYIGYWLFSLMLPLS